MGCWGLWDPWGRPELSQGHSVLTSGGRVPAGTDGHRLLQPTGSCFPKAALFCGAGKGQSGDHWDQHREPRHPLPLPGKAWGGQAEPSLCPSNPIDTSNGDGGHAATSGRTRQQLGPAGLILWGNLGISRHTHAGLAARGQVWGCPRAMDMACPCSGAISGVPGPDPTSQGGARGAGSGTGDTGTTSEAVASW